MGPAGDAACAKRPAAAARVNRVLIGLHHTTASGGERPKPPPVKNQTDAGRKASAERQVSFFLHFIPRGASLNVLREAPKQCGACELCRRATQPVWGEGDPAARIALVGEQPGDEEDLCGRPFVGPAGTVLNNALEVAGLVRSELYVTNSVKAFRFEERGKRRIHQTPRSRDIAVCRPWLQA